jgi:hypothetical protein
MDHWARLADLCGQLPLIPLLDGEPGAANSRYPQYNKIGVT